MQSFHHIEDGEFMPNNFLCASFHLLKGRILSILTNMLLQITQQYIIHHLNFN